MALPQEIEISTLTYGYAATARTSEF